MHLQDFDYHLPERAIAQQPWVPRDQCKMLVLHRGIHHRIFSDLVDYLQDGDVLVINDTRVRHARLHAHKDTGGKLELLVLDNSDGFYTCLVRGKVRRGTVFYLDADPAVQGTVLAKNGGQCRVELPLSMEEVEQRGEMPLPPYIREEVDRETAQMYQTTYAREAGSVAAPTAGLHFTPRLLETLRGRGVAIAPLTLHVGMGTFMPIRSPRIEEHQMEPEYYQISEDTARTINQAGQQGRRVIAVGTTTVKALESAAGRGLVATGQGWSNLFIYPGYRFRSPLTGILTNFHLPRSTPLLLTCAFAGREPILRAYGEALDRGYRFLSFGDAMLILEGGRV
ncbi:MAG: tRNA preQ1(34) S-adenosylmethionine ribosyltransferase-isomerase QueA [Thermoplasmatota archaeon]